MHRIALIFILTTVVGSTMVPSLAAQSELARITVWDGAYTTAQAQRGQAEYENNCIGCHKGNGENINPESRLRGKQFMDRWREDDVDSLFGLIKATMPRRDPGSLGDETYIDIIAYLMQANGFPAGAGELTLARSVNVRIEGKDGPRPLPHGALVQVVGCLTQGEDSWLLTRASEPIRTKTPDHSMDKELEAAASTALGNLYFRLPNIQLIGNGFRPIVSMDSKIHIKGYVIRQPNRERIDVTSVAVIDPVCGQ